MAGRPYEHSLFNAYAASGTTAPLQTSVLDMDGFEGVLFIAAATVTSTAQWLAMEMGTGSATASFSEATGQVDHTVQGLYLDVLRPSKRYVRGSFTASGGSSPGRAIVAIRYGARSQPTTQEATNMVGLALSSPGSGTATG